MASVPGRREPRNRPQDTTDQHLKAFEQQSKRLVHLCGCSIRVSDTYKDLFCSRLLLWRPYNKTLVVASFQKESFRKAATKENKTAWGEHAKMRKRQTNTTTTTTIILPSCAMRPHATCIHHDNNPHHGGFSPGAKGVRYTHTQNSRPRRSREHLFRGTSKHSAWTAHRL